jgi:hypothetical protein
VAQHLSGEGSAGYVDQGRGINHHCLGFDFCFCKQDERERGQRCASYRYSGIPGNPGCLRESTGEP